MALITNDNAYHGFPLAAAATHHHHDDKLDILADIRKDIGEAQSTIKDSIQAFQLHNSVEFKHIAEKISDAERENLKATLEGRIKMAEMECKITKEIGDKSCGIEKEIHESKICTLKQFEKVQEEICDFRRAEVQARLDASRDELAALRASASSQSSLDTILRAIAGLPVVANFK